MNRKHQRIQVFAGLALLYRPNLGFQVLIDPRAHSRTEKFVAGVKQTQDEYGGFEGQLGVGDQERFLLPVFPLRKSVRLPTESIILNLFESRYLAMAEFVLQHPTSLSAWDSTIGASCFLSLRIPAFESSVRGQENIQQRNRPLFGALFSADMPHVVRGDRTRPPVPIASPGDIGVVFEVSESQEDMIPTLNGECRRRIRLCATSLHRFSVEQILHDGYSDCSLPFMVVLASSLWDYAAQPQEYSVQLDSINRDPSSTILPSADSAEGGSGLGAGAGSRQQEMPSFKEAAETLEANDTRRRLEVLQTRSALERLSCLRASVHK
jgi:hypothetical protein